ncbi:glycosyltransferase family 39 protein [Sphingomonas sp.]|uniref:glycosyltransferase family 39 protein n=1 Tax=Sphingomonas sp. TaxID=28214 RepID=UPI001DB500E4|nr:glycosyltransferase family 39 protein [Sphingomonas sp.]MBX9796022.1 glycosyltransferase family 39 protein [Sphingomonas sp.]
MLPPSRLSPRQGAAALALIVLLALAVRLAAGMVLSANLGDADQASYFMMAQTLAGQAPMRDIWGNAAFYSPGYPFVLAPFFALFGAWPAVALVPNLILVAISILLLHALARRLAGRGVALLAALFFALLAPMVVANVTLTRENLSVPLLIGFALALVMLLDTRRPRIVAAVAGLIYGAGVLAGGSVILTALALPLALWWRGRAGRPGGPAVAFALGVAVVLGPWLWHTDAMLGRPVLTTNAAFNLYIGNNANATGRFVSMRDTPLGSDRWRQLHRDLGELAATDRLGDLARAHIAAHPGDTARLAAWKLALFWLPEPPHADEGQGLAVRLLRWASVAQQLALLAMAAVALTGWRRFGRGMRVMLAVMALFWAVHAGAYVIPRYNLPVMPFLCLLAAGATAPLLRRAAPARLKMVLA